jgi:hypothetical protein
VWYQQTKLANLKNTLVYFRRVSDEEKKCFLGSKPGPDASPDLPASSLHLQPTVWMQWQLEPRDNVIKLFTAAIYKCSQ